MKQALFVVALATVGTLLRSRHMLTSQTPAPMPQPSAGDISSVFNSLSQQPFAWPLEYTALKQQLAPPPQVLQSAWKRLGKALDPEIALIHQLQGDVVPQVQYADRRGTTDSKARCGGDSGCGPRTAGPRLETPH